MSEPLQPIDTQHTDMVHDSQFDYYAKKLATCSSDRTIKIFDVDLKNQATLTGHEGPVWQVAWAHPKFGVLLASCSYDGSVIIHREAPANTWTKIYQHTFHSASVNGIAWAPQEFGLVLACASSDGTVSILEYQNQEWKCIQSFLVDKLGCNAVSWAPYSALGSDDASDDSAIMRLVTASCDNQVKIWRRKKVMSVTGEVEWKWCKEEVNIREGFTPHTDWVRDVAWAPNTAMPYNIIASCSEDETVCIWKQTAKDKPWEVTKMTKNFGAPVWRLSWSVTGNVLAVATGDQQVTLWKQSVGEEWVTISSLEG